MLQRTCPGVLRRSARDVAAAADAALISSLFTTLERLLANEAKHADR